MSIYIQEVLNLLQRGKKKKKMDKVRDFFEFGKRYQTSSLSKGPTYQPRMEPFVINFGDLVCEITEDLTRTQPGSGNTGFIPVYTDPEGSCAWDTLMDSIMTQAGNTITVNNGNLVVDLQLTAGSANILDLTEDRIVIVGANGELEDDANFTFDGTEFNIGQGNFTVQVGTGNTQIIGTLDVDGQSTLASANVEDLTEDRLVIAGVNGELEDSPNLTFDGNELTTTSLTVTDLTEDRVVIVGPGGQLEDDANFTFDGSVLLVDGPSSHLHGDIELGKTPSDSIYVNGAIVDAAGNTGQANQVLIGQADGTVLWGNDDIVETLTHGALWYGDSNNLKIELPISDPNSILVSDGTVPQWQTLDSLDIVTGQGTVYRLPLWTPSDDELGDSILVQDGDSTTPATQVTVEGKAIVQGDLTAESNATVGGDATVIGDLTVDTNTLLKGNLEVQGTTKLDSVSQDDTLTEILVRDTANDNEVKFRDASTIIPAVGFDTIPMGSATGWGFSGATFKNAYIAVDDTTHANAKVSGMTHIVDGDRGVVVAENTKSGAFLADAAVIFPDYTFSGTAVSHRISWQTYGTASDRGYQTSDLKFGESLKFSYAYRQASSNSAVLYWDSCCKLFSANVCPVVNNATITTDEDTAYNGTLITNDDGYGGYGNTFTIISGPSNGTISGFNASTGAYTYTPNLNYYNNTTPPSTPDSFTYKVNDGYCDSNTATVNIVVNSVPEAPVWTSTDPTDPSYGANSWSNPLGGTALTTYNWTVEDPDHAASQLNITFSLVDANGAAATWLTFTNNNDGTGTLSGTYPVTAGTFTATLTATDPDGLTGVQTFPIAGVVPDKDTYFAFWIDNSGSMVSLSQTIARQASIGQVIVEVTNITNNSITCESNTNYNESFFINDIDKLVANNPQVGGGGHLLLPENLGSLSVSSLATVQKIDTTNGTLTNVVDAGGTDALITNRSGSSLSVSVDATNMVNAGDYLLLTISDDLALYDYNDPNNLRSLFQDFYAIGDTLAEEIAAGVTPNPATNGQNRYNTHVKFGFMNGPVGSSGVNDANGEDWFRGLVNYGYQDTQSEFNASISTGGIFDGATTICTLVWGDEVSTTSGGYDEGSNAPFDRSTAGASTLLADINAIKNWINYGPAATMNGTATAVNAVGCFFAAAASPNQGGGVDDSTLISTGLRLGVANSDFIGGSGGWTDGDLLVEPSPGNPRKIEFEGYTGSSYTNGIPQDNTTSGFYQNLVRTKLQDLGFTDV